MPIYGLVVLMALPKAMWPFIATLSNSSELVNAGSLDSFARLVFENHPGLIAYACAVFCCTFVVDYYFSNQYLRATLDRVQKFSFKQLDNTTTSGGKLLNACLTLLAITLSVWTAIVSSMISALAFQSFGRTTQVIFFAAAFPNYFTKRYETISQILLTKTQRDGKKLERMNFLQKYKKLTTPDSYEIVVIILGSLLAVSSAIVLLLGYIPFAIDGLELIFGKNLGRSEHYQNPISFALGISATLSSASFYAIHNFFYPRVMAYSLHHCIDHFKEDATQHKNFYVHMALTFPAFLLSYWFGSGFFATLQVKLEENAYSYLGDFSQAFPYMVCVSVFGLVSSQMQLMLIKKLHKAEGITDDTGYKHELLPRVNVGQNLFGDNTAIQASEDQKSDIELISML